VKATAVVVLALAVLATVASRVRVRTDGLSPAQATPVRPPVGHDVNSGPPPELASPTKDAGSAGRDVLVEAQPVEAAAARPKPRHSPHRRLSPLDEIDEAVALTPEQRPRIGSLVAEREAAMHAAYAEAVGGGEAERGVDEVARIFAGFEGRIRELLAPEQVVRYDEGRRAGRVAAPVFVFRYGE